MIPGEYLLADGDIELNVGKPVTSIAVTNSGDRPVQVGSHYHFYEVNRALKFERENAFGKRLNIASGTAVRFEPGQTHTVELIQLGGEGVVFGCNGIVHGSVQDEWIANKARARMKEFCESKE